MDENFISSEMIRGHIDTIILLSLVDGDRDSNEIRLDITEKSLGKYTVKQGTFYSAIARLVKQKYIKEYRSSAEDGIRRKYYSLTDKGRKSVDKSRNEWVQSKEIIDDLIETPTEKRPDIKEKPVIKDDFEDFKNIVENIDNINVGLSDEVDTYVNDICNLEFDEISAEINENEKELKIDENIEENQEIYETDVVQSDTLIDPFDGNSDNLSNDNETAKDSVDECADNEQIVFDNLTEENEAVEEVIDITPEQKAPTSEIKTSNATDVEGHVVSDDNSPDDYLVIESDKPIQREYRSILNLIYPKQENSQKHYYDTESATEDAKTKSDYEQISFENIEDEKENVKEEVRTDVTETNKIRRETSYSPVYSSESFEFDNGETEQETSNSSDSELNFDDLIKKGKEERFKVRVSTSTNKHAGARILHNKLVFHSALLFYLISFIELFILDYAFDSVLHIPVGVKIAIPSILFVFPLVALIFRLFNGNAAIYEISPFKNVIEVTLIIAFQIIIIALGVALFARIDFNVFKDVLAYLILPTIFAINIPLYFIIKYSLLTSGKYYID